MNSFIDKPLKWEHKPTEADLAILQECPELNKYICDLLKDSVGLDLETFWSISYYALFLRQIYTEKGREGLQEAEKIFVKKRQEFEADKEEEAAT
jgi:hypothetical protein